MMSQEFLVEKLNTFYPKLLSLREEVAHVLVGQKNLLDKLIMGLLTDGNILVEGLPGLAKTTVIKGLAKAIDASFSRIQFTPDLLPADLIGTQIYSQKEETFRIKKGPLFAHFVLADEINRAPAKVQSALLEAMQEKQVTIADETFELPPIFLVMATQNPIDQEGTYPLPEAQVDRFMAKVKVSYPTLEEEKIIMKEFSSSKNQNQIKEKMIRPVLSIADILAMREFVDSFYVDDKIYDYVGRLIFSTRMPAQFGIKELEDAIELGASPRASLNLIRAAKAFAFFSKRTFVTPQDVKAVFPDIIRHRLKLSFEALAKEMTAEEIMVKILDTVDVP